MFKDVVVMDLFYSCSLYLELSEKSVTLTSGIYLLVLLSFSRGVSRAVTLSMVCATISRMGASNRSGGLRTLTIRGMLFSVQVLRLSGSDCVLFVAVDFLKLLPFVDSYLLRDE